VEHTFRSGGRSTASFQVNAGDSALTTSPPRKIRCFGSFRRSEQPISRSVFRIWRHKSSVLRQRCLAASSDTARGAILNQDGTINQPTNPARRGAIVVIFGTGFGAVSSGPALSTTVVPVTARFGSRTAPASFSGLAPGFVGLYQVNVTVPQTCRRTSQCRYLSNKGMLSVHLWKSRFSELKCRSTEKS